MKQFTPGFAVYNHTELVLVSHDAERNLFWTQEIAGKIITPNGWAFADPQEGWRLLTETDFDKLRPVTPYDAVLFRTSKNVVEQSINVVNNFDRIEVTKFTPTPPKEGYVAVVPTYAYYEQASMQHHVACYLESHNDFRKLRVVELTRFEDGTAGLHTHNQCVTMLSVDDLMHRQLIFQLFGVRPDQMTSEWNDLSVLYMLLNKIPGQYVQFGESLRVKSLYYEESVAHFLQGLTKQ